MDRIVINENTTILQSKRNASRYRSYDTMTTQKFANNIVQIGMRNSALTELLPPNCRLHEHYYGTDFFVTEYPPMMRSIKINIDFSKRWSAFVEHCNKNNLEDAIKYYDGKNKSKKEKGRRTRIFEFLMPYTIFITEINMKDRWYACFCFFRNKPLSKLSDKIGKVPFYNIDRDQRACFSVPLERDDMFGLSKHEAVDATISAFWHSQFNSDYKSNMTSYRFRMNVVNYFMWEYISHTNPMSIFEIKWIDMKQNLIEFLGSRMNRCGRHINKLYPGFGVMKQAFRM